MLISLKYTFPLVGGINPVKRLIRVVFPEPDVPWIPILSFSTIDKFIFSNNLSLFKP